ncbi:IucA/IucC family protein [Pseudomonas proteolytica]|uniref:IucA/IucC family protein n=1 Tax=Pseudomonas proteolytica TaxID=219574 RepID=UPI00089BBA82|nr:IucA/IucC family protein [Pseudomonas proteolytica]KAA8704886.1 IucA/IucC family siderophore biosynthesis protein [Pseudomonas proteolytica]TWR82563.1 IucA/IucC family siderophore biosynthesis protein [Pseudomonas proteolytica]SEE01988.1 Siderophore synthetase component [Pseudomonas proteolytica]
MSLHPEDADQALISRRIIDCCLREDIRGIVSKGQICRLPEELSQHLQHQPDASWLRIAHLGADELWLPVVKAYPLQDWIGTGDAWIKVSPQSHGEVQHGYGLWLGHLSHGLDEESLTLFAAYLKEADCATEHRTLCNQAYRQHGPALSDVTALKDWSQRLLKIDQLASYLDHPFYPTARAKSGFDAAALKGYAPEFAPRFELNWLAIPNNALTLTSPQPLHWPDFEDVGLSPTLQNSHSLLPVHPLTWGELEQYGLPEGTLKAPRSAMQVEPTLSVRTVVCINQPQWHIKLPLLVSTLGTRNLRLIKPSTLYDGHWFQTTLQALTERDPALASRYLHVDEKHGGHAAESRHLAYIVRRYPTGLENTTLVPVAALASPLADGRLFLEQLAERFYAGSLQHWLDDYLDLLLQVHLRLWLHYGIALETNQQNAVLMFEQGQPLRLLMKDNDAARLWPQRFTHACPDLADLPAVLQDERIRVDSSQPLAEMFCTITLQLNIVAILEAIATAGLASRSGLYGTLRQRLMTCLQHLEAEGIDCDDARRWLLDSPKLPVKYLLSAGSLFSKAHSGASDINKFYGYSAANFLLEDAPCNGV